MGNLGNSPDSSRPARRYRRGKIPDEAEKTVYETYRMLGRAHEAELEREARKFQLAAAAKPRRPIRRQNVEWQPGRLRLVRARLVALIR